MKYREFGKTGCKISTLGFGAMRMPTIETDGKKVIDEEKAIALIRRAIDSGVNYVDTEKKVQPKIISSKKKYRIPKNYKSFCDKLNQIEADSDKILYSYVTLIELSRRGHNKLKKSDTPREMAKKLRRDSKYRDIEKITEVFEIIEYARADIDPNDARFVIDTMQNIIRVSIEH